MKLRTHLLLFFFIFAWEARRTIGEFGNSAPQVGDAIEVHNIAYNLAHGHGYRFDWDNPDWKRLWQVENKNGVFDFILARHGSHPTLFRPPLMPILVAGTIRLFPSNAFLAWRIFDSAGFAIGACILCEIAYVHGHAIGLIAMLVMLLCDRLRWSFIPGWWTEGIAFDLLCIITWLLTQPRKFRSGISCPIAGVAVGLLCLDRSVFVLMMLPLCALLGITCTSGLKARIRNLFIILFIAMAVQMPWWVRNVAISGRFLPLGTQGGFNLPDEYGEIVFKRHAWSGLGMRDAWTPRNVPNASIPLPAGFTERSFDQLWIGDRKMQSLIAATFCTSLESEIAVSERGKQAAWKWIQANYARLPGLMLFKAEGLTFFFHTSLTVAGVITLVGFLIQPNKRRLLTYLALFVALYFGVIALTHVVWWRFLLPILPATYVAIAIGISAMVDLMTNVILAKFLRKLL